MSEIKELHRFEKEAIGQDGTGLWWGYVGPGGRINWESPAENVPVNAEVAAQEILRLKAELEQAQGQLYEVINQNAALVERVCAKGEKAEEDYLPMLGWAQQRGAEILRERDQFKEDLECAHRTLRELNDEGVEEDRRRQAEIEQLKSQLEDQRMEAWKVSEERDELRAQLQEERGVGEERLRYLTQLAANPPRPARRKQGRAEEAEVPTALVSRGPLLGDPFLAAWNEYLSWRRHVRRVPVNLPWAQRLLDKVLAPMGPERAIAALEFSMNQGYQGVVEPKGQPQAPKAQPSFVPYHRKEG